MKIYTKGGDKGKTSLVGGERVPKNHPRVQAYGDVDELISYLGLIRSDIRIEGGAETIRRIQQNLMLGSAHLASESKVDKLKHFDPEEITFLEKEIDRMTEMMPPQNAFILPAGPRLASECHVARTICRRAERSSLAIEDDCEQVARTRKYLNRLSDYLFCLGRFICFSENVPEDFWLP